MSGLTIFTQFCANDPEVLLEAAKRVEDRCAAVDINFGCPQGIAKRGRYGAFLQGSLHWLIFTLLMSLNSEDWETTAKLIQTLHENLSVPVTCKIRLLPDPEKTLEYAKMIQDSGCQVCKCQCVEETQEWCRCLLCMVVLEP